jgi:2-polyprenyl-3-methyl-5-hydroxy-6-metoxy-1,4-benzoquinol methylase
MPLARVSWRRLVVVVVSLSWACPSCHAFGSFSERLWIDNIPMCSTTAISAAPRTSIPEECRRLPLASAAEDLQQLLHTNNTTPIQVQGYVTAKRGFGNSFCFLDVTDATHWRSPVQAILKRQDYQADDCFDGWMKVMVPGIELRITGPAAPSRNPGQALLVTHAIEIVQLPRNPQHIRIVLQAVCDGILPWPTLVGSIAPWRKHFDNVETVSMDLAKEVSKSLPQLLADGYPAEILSRKNDKGVYTLPAPEDDFQHPPVAMTNRSEPTLIALEPLSVQNVANTSQTPDSGSRSVVVQGFVQNRRRYSSHITVLELVDNPTRVAEAGDFDDRSKHQELWTRRLKCVLHPACTANPNEFGQLLAPGTNVVLSGYYAQSSDTTGEDLLWVEHVKLLRSSWRPSVVQYLIELVAADKFDSQEAGQALGRSDSEMDEITNLPDLTARQWKAAEVSRDLQSMESRMAVIAPEMLQVLDSFEGLRKQFPIQASQTIQTSSEKESIRDGSRWKRKKEPQLDWMAQQVDLVIRAHPEFGQRKLKILDVGGGKGYLANHLASKLGENIEIQVIDVAVRAVKNGAMRSQRLQLPVTYTAGDASAADFDGTIDVVVALRKYTTLEL